MTSRYSSEAGGGNDSGVLADGSGVLPGATEPVVAGPGSVLAGGAASGIGFTAAVAEFEGGAETADRAAGGGAAGAAATGADGRGRGTGMRFGVTAAERCSGAPGMAFIALGGGAGSTFRSAGGAP